MACKTKAWRIRRIALTLCVVLSTVRTGFAQSFTVLHTFSQTSGGNSDGTAFGSNWDGANPMGSLVSSGSTLYGTTLRGGTGSGIVFGINTDGTGFTNLHSFAYPSIYVSETNRDGAEPVTLLIAGNTLYGTTLVSGAAGYGTVFRMNTNGSQFTTLYNFTNGIDGANPRNLALSGGTLYGLALGNSFATIYTIDTNGNNFVPLYHLTNYDASGLVLSGDAFYICAAALASGEPSTIFQLNADGLELQTLWALDPNSNGANIVAGPTIVNNVLYGTAANGGPGGSGTVFSIPTVGRGFTILHSFSATQGTFPISSNADGAFPGAPITASANQLLGTTEQGGAAGNGVVFEVNTNGTGFGVLHVFSSFNSPYSNHGNCDGAYPLTDLIVSGNTAYGTCYSGGIYASGTIFALDFTPASIPLNFQWTNNNVVLSWTNAAFNLQSAPAVSGVYTNIPGASSPYTNAATASQMFFRLVAY